MTAAPLNSNMTPPGQPIEGIESVWLSMQTLAMFLDLDSDNYVWQTADFMGKKLHGEEATIGPEVIPCLKALAVTLNVPEKHFLYEAMHYVADHRKT